MDIGYIYQRLSSRFRKGWAGITLISSADELLKYSTIGREEKLSTLTETIPFSLTPVGKRRTIKGIEITGTNAKSVVSNLFVSDGKVTKMPILVKLGTYFINFYISEYPGGILLRSGWFLQTDRTHTADDTLRFTYIYDEEDDF